MSSPSFPSSPFLCKLIPISWLSSRELYRLFSILSLNRFLGCHSHGDFCPTQSCQRRYWSCESLVGYRILQNFFQVIRQGVFVGFCTAKRTRALEGGGKVVDGVWHLNPSSPLLTSRTYNNVCGRVTWFWLPESWDQWWTTARCTVYFPMDTALSGPLLPFNVL